MRKNNKGEGDKPFARTYISVTWSVAELLDTDLAAAPPVGIRSYWKSLCLLALPETDSPRPDGPGS